MAEGGEVAEDFGIIWSFRSARSIRKSLRFSAISRGFFGGGYLLFHCLDAGACLLGAGFVGLGFFDFSKMRSLRYLFQRKTVALCFQNVRYFVC